ncbi:MAG: nuclear transport factor 2 family protein [Gracilimonas sp.]|jgi:ketosteroid isomerase-like protein|uniref:nuclear transport factor 2 family protein n=1 Tax=Gracilimonas sp. TaxID=1974203 RepID=UPI0037536166|nr:nuclear transport factor 2 family protein [Gracilimonas sp.]
MKTVFTLTLILISTSIVAVAQQSEKQAISKTLADFENAIVENNSEVASGLLHDNVIILEGSSSETKEQYLSHHFHSDGRFLSAMNREVISEQITIEGNIAWVSSQTKMTGTYNEREIDRTSLELAVLKKENGEWKIIALHWS